MDYENVKEALVRLLELGQSPILEKRSPIDNRWELYNITDLQDDICSIAYSIADLLGMQELYLKEDEKHESK